MKYATSYLNQVLEKVKPLLRGNGGPIIMVQVMNLHFCDKYYYVWLMQYQRLSIKMLIARSEIARFIILRWFRITVSYIDQY